MKKEIQTKNAPAAIGPYSQGIISGNLIFSSGQIGIDPKTSELVEGIKEQTYQVFRNIKAILEEAGSDFNNVIKVVVFIKDMNDFPLVNEIYKEHFTESYPPARSTVEVSNLPKNALIEIEVIAVVK